jgi:biotin transport system substrate-specific component
MTGSVRTAGQAAIAPAALRQATAVLAGAVLVALGAQVSLPLPGTPIPMTFQLPAVLVVGGLLGPRLGASSLAVYLLLGAVGLPVFAPMGLPGVARLFGPTGGYLLALPLAAAVAGAAARPPLRVARLAAGFLLALGVIHAGGIAQLAILGGDMAVAWRVGSLPFLAGDVAKLLLAGVVVGRFNAPVRRALL